MTTLEEPIRAINSGTTTPTALEEENSLEQPLTRTLERGSKEVSSKPTKTESILLQWPSQKLESGSAKPVEVFLNVLSIGMAFLIIAYIVFLLRYDGREIQSLPPMWDFVREFSRLGPTLVPLMFAFVVGRTVRSFAHWRLQQGERIGFLDSLFGSTTMTGTVTTMIDSRRISAAGLILIFAWSLSPIGGQATLRVLLRKPGHITSNGTFPYLLFNSSIPTKFRDMVNGEEVPVNTLYFGSVGASDRVRNSSLDPWGNVKVPMIESLPQYSVNDSKDWLTVSQTPGSVVYSGLLGIPVGNVPEQLNSSFTLDVSYLKMDCVWRNLSASAEDTMKNECIEKSKDNCYAEFTWGAMGFIGDYRRDRCGDYVGNTPRLLYYWKGGRDIYDSLADCTLSTSYVQILVVCVGWDCQPKKMRRAPVPENATLTGTFLDKFGRVCRDDPHLPSYFFKLFNSTTRKNHNDVGNSRTSLVQTYLVNPDTGLNTTASKGLPSTPTIREDILSIRLAQLLNTYWTAIVGSEPLFLGHPRNYDSVTLKERYQFPETEATIHTSTTFLRYDKAWLTVLIVTVAFLMLAAVIGLVLDLNIRIPRLLMNVSTLTRGSPNFGVPVGGGALSDEARAKLLSDVAVRFGETETKGSSHDLIIGDCVEKGGRVSRISKGKVYGE